jgi:hypothetical protein
LWSDPVEPAVERSAQLGVAGRLGQHDLAVDRSLQTVRASSAGRVVPYQEISPPSGPNRRVRDECLNINMFSSPAQARVVTAAQPEAAGPARCCVLEPAHLGGRRRRYGSADARYGVALSPYHRTRTTGKLSYEHRKEARWLTMSRWRTAGSTRARTRR